MKFALIRHRHKSPKTFWFWVPEELERYVTTGSFVFCENEKGYAPGKVVQTYEDEDMEMFCEEWDMDIDRMKPLLEVCTKVPRSSVFVPKQFRDTPPKKEKLEKKMQYYNEHRKFESRIIVDEDMVLLDGLTSFCIAEAKNMRVVPVMVASRNAVNKGLYL